MSGTRRPCRRVAIIGSCVTRDIWNQAGFTDDDRPDLLYVARTGLASLMSRPVQGFVPPAGPVADLTPWELRMVVDDLLKRGLPRLLDYRPTHLVIDLIDERFDQLALDDAVVIHSWELQRSGLLGQAPLAAARRIDRASAMAQANWRDAAVAFAAFLRAELPQTQVFLHDARWALEYVDVGGALKPFEKDRMLWEGRPANIDVHNRVLADCAKALRRWIPGLRTLRAPPAVRFADAGHRWGLSPFHYVEPYYAHMWRRLGQQGVHTQGGPGRMGLLSHILRRGR